MNLFGKIKNYFFGSLLDEEMDALELASTNVVFYVLIIALSLVTVVEISYLFSYDIVPLQHGLATLTLICFTGALFLVRWTKSIQAPALIMVCYSFLVRVVPTLILFQSTEMP
ncbi:hypothetical protein N8Z73_00140 [bacterium]|nr:hypothetical protein [bacterium]